MAAALHERILASLVLGGARSGHLARHAEHGRRAGPARRACWFAQGRIRLRHAARCDRRRLAEARTALRRRLSFLLDRASSFGCASRRSVPESEPAVDSLLALYNSARFAERECHDMYGIEFRGNADLRPILLYEGFVGHPLRKDYPKQREQPLVSVSEGCDVDPQRHCPIRSGPPSDPASARHDDRQHRPFASGDSRNGPDHRRDVRRTDPARRRALRLPAPRLREGMRVAYLAQSDPLRRPAQLLLRADQRLRVLRCGRALDGHRDHAALPVFAHAARRVLAHRRSPHLHGCDAHGTRRHDGIPLPGHAAGLHLRAPR